MKVGVIGAGAISGIYLENMINRFDNLDVVCIAARRIESAKKKAAEYGIRACTVDELLDDRDVEMAVVLTPAETHYDLIRRALLAGKHAYTEKTITDDPAKAAELAALADEKGLYLGSAPDTFLGAALQTAKKAIDEGMLGDINSFAISATRNYDVLMSYFTYMRQPGCGIIYDYGVYYMTALVSLLGEVDRVAAFTATPYPERRNIMPETADYGDIIHAPNESQVSAVLKMKSGAAGTLHIDADNHLMDEGYFAIYGTKGTLYLSDPDHFGGDVRFSPVPDDPRETAPDVILEPVSEFTDNCRGIGPAEMAEAIAEGRPCKANKELACHVLSVLTAMLRSGETGEMQQIK